MSHFAVVWFRNDLRTLDHQALHSAFASGLPVVGLYIATPQTWQLHDMAPIKQDLLRRRVRALEMELAELKVPLLALEASSYADSHAIFQQLIVKGVKFVSATTEYELREQVRDRQVQQLLHEAGVEVVWHDQQCVMPPGSLVTKSGDVYKVFTPFKKNWLGRFQLTGIQVLPRLTAQSAMPPSLQLSWPAMVDGDQSSRLYPVHESEVLAKLRSFCQHQVASYHDQRDYPAVDGTSGLSAYLAIGVLSAAQCVARLQLEAGDALWQADSGASVWLSELIWREFYKHILVAYPNLIKHQPFQQETAALAWGNNTAWFEAWCQGKTGYPIVDAAMHQLNQTGWMHNRLRMIVASFLVKDLQIDWRWGERYFMQKLIDGEFAANNGGWQWAASTGTDAAPYFRIFNPVTQSERFDPKGIFIKQWLPELANIPTAAIHWPHAIANCRYVRPIVDHAKAREKTLAMFKAIRGDVA